MEEKRGVETAEPAGAEGASVQNSITGALKSQNSSNNEKVKRASAVRFAD